MATIVSIGPFFIPVRYESWVDWRRDHHGAATAPMLLVPAETSFCATCWGQGRILSPARNGEGLVPVTCPTCAGEGVVRPPPV